MYNKLTNYNKTMDMGEDGREGGNGRDRDINTQHNMTPLLLMSKKFSWKMNGIIHLRVKGGGINECRMHGMIPIPILEWISIKSNDPRNGPSAHFIVFKGGRGNAEFISFCRDACQCQCYWMDGG
jgi:hypothetical protein